MSKQQLFLAPGFCITLGKANRKFSFSQLSGRLLQATADRLKIIDTLNQGFDGDVPDLTKKILQETGAERHVSRRFINALESAGYLSSTGPAAPQPEHQEAPRADVSADTVITLVAPISFVSRPGCYCLYSHSGDLVIRVSLEEILVVEMFGEETTLASVRENYESLDRPDKLDSAQFEHLIARLAGAELFCTPQSDDDMDETALTGGVDKARLQARVDARVKAHDASVSGRSEHLPQVVPVNTVHGTTPASLGLVMAYAMRYEGNRLHDRYNFVPMFLTEETRIAARAQRTGVFLFSNYMWNVDDNLQLSELVKRINPQNITIHGGPSTPSYVKDCENFFAEHPHVDIAVRGEGEKTFTDILDALRLPESCSLEGLETVVGITFRTADGVHRTGDRERIQDLNTIPSPYLEGLFDEFGDVRASAIIETNRGCPYGCTFCDWGSATLSKVRKFSIERVFAELEWSASHRVEDTSIADANFGMLPRDVEITQKIADLRKEYQHPNTVGVNYAKNQVKYLKDIIRILAGAGILADGKLSFQSRDEVTLETINRSNIKLSKYNELATAFRKARLPLGVELMMGLPGSTKSSFIADLQDCTDRDVRVQVAPTQLLPNSPMNDPQYREEHGIIAKAGEFVEQTTTYTHEEWQDMMTLRDTYALFDTYGIARYIARYLRAETGMRELEFYEQLQVEALKNPSKWPLTASAIRTLQDHMSPPGSWSFFVEELKRFVIEKTGIEDSSALRTALEVQLAHLPAADRQFPIHLELEHDFSAWWDAMLEARESDHRSDWEKHIPSLSEFGPGTLTIDDPNKICQLEIGQSLHSLGYNLRTWEFESPVARARATMSVRQ